MPPLPKEPPCSTQDAVAGIPDAQPQLNTTGNSTRVDASVESSSAQLSATRKLHKTPSLFGPLPRVGKSTISTAVTKATAVGGTLLPKASVDLSRFDVSRPSGSASSQSETNATASQTDSTTTTTGGRRKPSAVSPTYPTIPSSSKEPTAQGCQVLAPAPPIVTERTGDQANDDSKSTTDSILSPPIPSTPVRPSTPVGWLGWLGWGAEALPAKESKEVDDSQDMSVTATDNITAAQHPEISATNKQGADTSSATNNGSSWIDYIWASLPAVPIALPTASVVKDTQVSDSELKPTDATSTAAQPDGQHRSDENVAPTLPTSPREGSTWAFWSRDSGNKSGRASSKESGEIAVIGESSESHPTPANRGEIDPSKSEGRATEKDGGQSDAKSSAEPKPRKDGRNSSIKKPGITAAANPKNASISSSDPEPIKANDSRPLGWKAGRTKHRPAAASDATKSVATVPPERPSSIKSGAESTTTPTPPNELAQSTMPQGPANLLLPTFNSTYSLDNPSITRQLGRMFLRSAPVMIPLIPPALSHVGNRPTAQIFRTKKVPRIRHAVAIGVHGLFPHTYLRAMIGQPTGTSLRFASLCAESIRRWADANDSLDCEIEKVALEGEGKISERVENLWKLLLNWEEHLRRADVIILACHSQGVPVGIMLLSKLLELNIITHARIGVCAMAGVSQGPFPYRTASIMGGSAAELLEFANPQSLVSRNYEQALRDVLAYGGRITYISSIDDQLVPLESAVHSPLHHPYIYRAVFVDGRIHAPDFLAHLIGFALKLRNLGISDHGLIRELSSPLAGSLYTGEGHSRLYFDSQVYDLAVQHALETTDAPALTEPEFRRPQAGTVGVANANPYHLPWIMRGLLEEGRVKTELSDETAELLRKFDDWNPVSTKLKEVKYKLEAIKSNL